MLFLSSQGETFGDLFVYDRDTTSTYQMEQSQNKYVWTLMTNDSWIKDTFTIQQHFSEEKSIFGNVRGTVYKYSKDAEARCLDQLVWSLWFPHRKSNYFASFVLCRIASQQEHFSGWEALISVGLSGQWHYVSRSWGNCDAAFQCYHFASSYQLQ